MNLSLKGCPFCGQTVHLVSCNDWHVDNQVQDVVVWIECDTCETEFERFWSSDFIPGGYKQETWDSNYAWEACVKWWNTRAQPLRVKLSRHIAGGVTGNDHAWNSGYNAALDACAEAIKAAGGTAE